VGTFTAPTEALHFADAANMAFDTTTGTKIGTATSQKIGFWNTTPVIQQSHIADATTQDLAGTDTVDETKLESDLSGIVSTINSILTTLETVGITAAA
jgi:hypothetical protein